MSPPPPPAHRHGTPTTTASRHHNGHRYGYIHPNSNGDSLSHPNATPTGTPTGSDFTYLPWVKR
ncbi:MAG: hypothetical protein R2856_09635 [Caldilineaceae bacterium]